MLLARSLLSWFRTVRRIPDCRDPPDTLLVGCVISGQSEGSKSLGILLTLCLWAVQFEDSQEDPRLSESSGHSACGLFSFRTGKGIPDCQDLQDTLLMGCVVSGLSGGSWTVGILWTLYSSVGTVRIL